MLARSITVFACTLLALGIASARAEPCGQEIMELTRKLAASDTGLDPSTAGTAAMADAQKQQQLGTSAMNNAKAGTSPHDGPHHVGTRFDANRALEHARGLDAQGKEAECMTEVMNARQLSGL